ncbi:MAG: HPP family protein [Phycisphaerae bacterium]|nr:HPP family protein [Phycisphaerae bacterium]
MTRLNMKSKATIIEKFKKLWMYYILQSFLAALALFVLVLVLGENKIVVITSIGATSFLVFAMPTAVSAQTRNVIGGHLVGLACGTIFYFTKLPYFVEYPCVVGMAIFLMVALDVEHPPAAGTALAVVINELSPIDAFVIMMISALILSQCRYFLRQYLKDLV